MIKLGLKNYLKSYRLFFLPIGALSLGIVIGLSIFLPALMGAIKQFFSGAVDIIGDVKPNWEAVWETIERTFRAIDYTDPEIAARAIFNRVFLGKLLNDCIRAAIDLESLQTQFAELLSACSAKAIMGGVALVVFIVLGGFVGAFATRVEIRRNIAKRKFWKFVLISVMHTVINVTIVAGGVWLISKFQKYAVLSGLLTLLLYGAVAFFEAYLVHGYKKVSLKKVLRVRNFLSLALLSVIEVAIMCAIIALIYLISNPAITFFVGYSVIVITLSCLSMNAEAYVKDMAAKLAVDAAKGEGADAPSPAEQPRLLGGATPGPVGTPKGEELTEPAVETPVEIVSTPAESVADAPAEIAATQAEETTENDPPARA